jgi:DNA-directed RNA polymerase beta' subunit
MVIKELAVAPPPVRPSVVAGDGVRSEDDLTYAYREIIKMNKQLKKSMDDGHVRGAQDSLLDSLQLYVATLMDNNLADCA